MAFTVTVTVAGAGQFSAAAAQTIFDELGPDVSATSGRDMYVEILQYSYNSLGAAHAYTLHLATGVVAGNLQILLEDRTNSNSMVVNCGIRVLRATTGSGATNQLFFSTVGKTGDGTLRITYRITSDRQ